MHTQTHTYNYISILIKSPVVSLRCVQFCFGSHLWIMSECKYEWRFVAIGRAKYLFASSLVRLQLYFFLNLILLSSRLHPSILCVFISRNVCEMFIKLQITWQLHFRSLINMWQQINICWVWQILFYDCVVNFAYLLWWCACVCVCVCVRKNNRGRQQLVLFKNLSNFRII